MHALIAHHGSYQFQLHTPFAAWDSIIWKVVKFCSVKRKSTHTHTHTVLWVWATTSVTTNPIGIRDIYILVIYISMNYVYTYIFFSEDLQFHKNFLWQKFNLTWRLLMRCQYVMFFSLILLIFGGNWKVSD